MGLLDENAITAKHMIIVGIRAPRCSCFIGFGMILPRWSKMGLMRERENHSLLFFSICVIPAFYAWNLIIFVLVGKISQFCSQAGKEHDVIHAFICVKSIDSRILSFSFISQASPPPLYHVKGAVTVMQSVLSYWTQRRDGSTTHDQTADVTKWQWRNWCMNN